MFIAIRQMASILCVVVFAFYISGCQNGHFAPVTSAWYQSEHASESHKVRAGETLYAIAFRYELDFRDLAKINGLKPPYHLSTGQLLKVKLDEAYKKQKVTQERKALARAQGINRKENLSKQVSPSSGHVKFWMWPHEGTVVSRFALAHRRKGIDIAGRLGDPVVAAAHGIVAYSGSGINGYGNMIIIKHNEELFSAYAHNHSLMVKEGQRVRAGQRIATMGHAGDRHLLHFEIRKSGKAINPLRYLPKRS